MNKSRWVLLALTAGLAVTAGLGCGSDSGTGPEPNKSGLLPESATLEVSSSQKFEATLDGQSLPVTWWVDGVLGGLPGTGMITAEGLYIAPPEVPGGGSVIVTAKSVDDTLLKASAQVTLLKNGGSAYIDVNPTSTSVAVFDSVRFQYSASGCSPSDPVWSMQVISGSPVSAGSLDAEGVYVPPSVPSCDFEIMIMARSGDCEDKTGIARVAVRVPELFFVELEEYTASAGEGIIRGVSCAGGTGITGLDEQDEWISVPINVPAGGRYRGEIRYAAGVGDRLDLDVTVEDGPYGTPSAAFILDAGSGVGG